MNADDTIRRVTAALEAAGIPYMLTGSLASSIHGRGRATMDVNLVIDPTSAQLRRFVGSLPGSEYYVDLATALDALTRRSQFNVIDLEAGWKVDLILRKERPFSPMEFGRRTEKELVGRRIPVATAEDVTLAKLEWAKSGGFHRQIEDAAGILKSRPELDRAYLEHWVGELGVGSEWQEALSLAGLV